MTQYILNTYNDFVKSAHEHKDDIADTRKSDEEKMRILEELKREIEIMIDAF